MRLSKREKGIALAFLMEGEGTISLHVEHSKAREGHRARKQPRVQFAVGNTNIQLMDRTKKIISSVLGRKVEYTNHKDARGYRPMHTIKIGTLSEVKTLCELILPFLSGKRRQAEIVLEFISLTPGRHITRNAKGQNSGRSKYTQRHFDLVDEIQFLNKRYAKGEWDALQRETERLAPAMHKQDEETIRAAWQHAETNRNVSSAVN